ncbi:serine/threonine-protein phosphatase [Candidatus Peregrinibacteria bacterium]|nr:serine/threonine-protein phosphatase [Candidatus Peregrinibacteria bacterium]
MSAKVLLSKKIYVDLFLSTLLLALIALIVNYFFSVTINLTFVVFFLVIHSLITFLIYYFDIVVPFVVILDQVKALLTNRNYKRIFVKRTDEVGIMAHFFNEVTTSLEKVTVDLEESRKVSGELKTAGQLQKELIPNMAPTIEGFDIAVKNRSAEELGGDNLDFIKVGSSTYFYVGDVTGHGVPAAIVMTMVNTLINAFAEIYDTAYEVVVQTNRRLKTRIRATMFMSMLMLKWNGMTKKMTYIGCGHEHLVIYRAKTGLVEALVSGGIALGMVPDNSKIVKEKDLPLEIGDVIVLYTDGITEAKNMKGEMFGLKRLTEAVSMYGGQGGAQDIVQNIAKDFSKFVEEHVQEDDVTLIAVKKLNDGVTGTSIIDQKQSRWTEETQK